MAEAIAALGVVASVAQLADYGFKLSVKLFTFSEAVYSADKSIKNMSDDVSLTSAVLKELSEILKADSSTYVSHGAIDAAQQTVTECLAIFDELDKALEKSLGNLGAADRDGRKRVNKGAATLERWKWPFKQTKMELLRTNLDRLKASLTLMLQVLSYARDLSARKATEQSLQQQKRLIEHLARSKRGSQSRYYLALRRDTQESTESTKEPPPRYTNSFQSLNVASVGDPAAFTIDRGFGGAASTSETAQTAAKSFYPLPPARSQPPAASNPLVDSLAAELGLCLQLLEQLLGNQLSEHLVGELAYDRFCEAIFHADEMQINDLRDKPVHQAFTKLSVQLEKLVVAHTLRGHGGSPPPRASFDVFKERSRTLPRSMLDLSEEFGFLQPAPSPRSVPSIHWAIGLLNVDEKPDEDEPEGLKREEEERERQDQEKKKNEAEEKANKEVKAKANLNVKLKRQERQVEELGETRERERLFASLKRPTFVPGEQAVPAQGPSVDSTRRHEADARTDEPIARLEGKEMWKLKFETEEKEEREKEKTKHEQELEDELRKKMAKFGFQENQIQAIMHPKKADRLPLGAFPDQPLALTPIYPKIRKENVEIETLQYFALPWEGCDDPEYILILQELSTREIDYLFEHTRKLRERGTQLFIEDRGRDRDGRLDYVLVRPRSKPRVERDRRPILRVRDGISNALTPSAEDTESLERPSEESAEAEMPFALSSIDSFSSICDYSEEPRQHPSKDGIYPNNLASYHRMREDAAAPDNELDKDDVVDRLLAQWTTIKLRGHDEGEQIRAKKRSWRQHRPCTNYPPISLCSKRSRTLRQTRHQGLDRLQQDSPLRMRIRSPNQKGRNG